MTDTGQLLRLIHGIVDPGAAIRSRAAMISKDSAISADMRQATADLGKAIEHVFEVASYIMKRESNVR